MGFLVAVFSEGPFWIAQHLELDIGAQGATPEEALFRLAATIKAEREHTIERSGVAFQGIPATPAAILAAHQPALATARQDGFDAALAIATRVANELTASGTGNQHAERAQGAWQVHTAIRRGG